MKHLSPFIGGVAIAVGIGYLLLGTPSSTPLASGAPTTNYQPNIMPMADSLYELGTSSRAWLRGNFDEICLTADSCATSWAEGTADGRSTWQLNSSGNALMPTTTKGISIQSSSTISDLSMTNATVTSAFNLFGTIGQALSDFCVGITGGSALCDGVDNTGGSISTSSIPTIGNLAYWTSGSALSGVATGTLTENVAGLELDQTRGLVGGSAILGLTSGYIIPTTTSFSNWNTAYSWGNHASAGYLTSAPANVWATTTGISYILDTTSDVVIGANTTGSAPFWWDVSATTSYIGNGGTGDSVVSLGATNNEWTLGYDATDKTFAIASSTTLGTNNALTIGKNLVTTLFGASTTAITVSGNSWLNLASSTGLTATNLYSTNASLTYASTTGISGTNLNYTNATFTTATATSLSVGTSFGLLGDIITNVLTWFDSKIEALTNVVAQGVWDFGGATSLEVPNGASPTVDATGEIAIDTTSDQVEYYGAGSVKILGNGNFYSTFTYATTTAWTGTTTLPLGPAIVAETWNSISCFTDAGTLNIGIGDGTNWTNNTNASTTVGLTNLTSNNTFTAGEKRYVRMGTPASAPTTTSCTISRSLTAD
jgi:hypothetical protein